MQVRVNANHTVQTQESLERWASQELTQALQRFAHDITSLEVHFSDENGERISADQRRCMIEARLAGHAPVAVSDSAERLDDALRGATDKLKSALDHALAKSRVRSRESIRRDGLDVDAGGDTEVTGMRDGHAQNADAEVGSDATTDAKTDAKADVDLGRS